jgi:cadmium resistance protein CadD (predicted permease)
MESSFALIGLAIALFASTNVDDVLVLVGFFADPTFRDRDIVIGQYAGIAALFGVSVVASLLALVIPRAYLGLLGFAAILIGAKNLLTYTVGAMSQKRRWCVTPTPEQAGELQQWRL